MRATRSATTGESTPSGTHLNYHGGPHLGSAIAEYEAFLGAIAELAPDVEPVFLPPPAGLTMGLLYPRDAAIACDRGMILCNMGKPARSAEPAAQAALFERLRIPIHGRMAAPGRLERGDVAWIDERTLAVGQGYRTNAEGIRQLQNLLSGDNIEVLTVQLPHHRGPATCSI